MKDKTTLLTLIGLHVMIALYSLSGVLSKLAAGVEPLSFSFIAFYGGSIAILGIYAIGWQQVIKHLPLTTAYANKAVTLLWSLVWGCLLFGEQVTLNKLIGVAIVLAGVMLFVISDGESPDIEDSSRGVDA